MRRPNVTFIRLMASLAKPNKLCDTKCESTEGILRETKKNIHGVKKRRTDLPVVYSALCLMVLWLWVISVRKKY